MANNPVQIVLNSGAFVDDIKLNPGGQNKDFFAGRDGDFAIHRAGLINQLSSAKASLASAGRSTGIARVTLNKAALAKSHRPTQSVLKPDVVPICGVSDFGELLIEFTPSSLDAVIEKIESAEPTTNLKLDRDGKYKAAPSRTRSEVGAISKVVPYGPSDRRQFSVGQAIEWLRRPRSGQYLLIQMFVPTDEPSHGEMRRRAEDMAALRRKLRRIDSSLLLSESPSWWTERGFLKLDMGELDFRADVFGEVLDALDNEPFVRKIWLPSIIKPTRSALTNATSGVIHALPTPNGLANYPVVGVVDTGIASIPSLDPWVVGRTSMGDPASQDTSHGTFIGALIADSQTLNKHAEIAEPSCMVYDLGLHVTDEVEYQDAYPNSFMDFLEQLDFETVSAVAAGVRVFNMSLVVEELVRDDAYSPFAARLDAIADRHDVVFVLPTGNLESPQFRPAWPEKAEDALAMLANYRHLGLDRLHQPADSIRAIVVAALDPKLPTTDRLVPSVYSRRGPGLALGSKPDLCHLGGSADPGNRLRSLDSAGRVVEGSGTSYAAPLVAKTLGQVDYKIAGRVKRETLTALVVHGAKGPAPMMHKKLEHVAKDFIGFGLPDSSDNVLLSDDHSITLVFEAELMHRKALTFDFQWPQSLVRPGGKCAGEATLTLVYRPPLDLRYGSETVRVNLEAYLRQEKVNTSTGELSYGGFFLSKSSSGQEHERVKEGQKWGAVKKWSRKTSRAGVGTSSQFRLVVEPLARSGFALPIEGIPFAAILTISDPWGDAPVFNQMRRSLQARDVAIADIRTAAQIRSRPGA